MAKLLTESHNPNDTGHIADHFTVARLLNEFYGVNTYNPGAGATVNPDVSLGGTHVINLPSGGTTTIGPATSSDASQQWNAGQQIRLLLVQPAGGGAAVTWDASWVFAPQPSSDGSSVTVLQFTNIGATGAAGPTWSINSPTNEAGPIANLPANGARRDGSRYLATDQNGGTPWEMVAGAWTQEAAGVTAASGQYAAGPVQQTAAISNVTSVGTTWTDMPGMSLTIPASNTRPITLRYRGQAFLSCGTSAAGSVVNIEVAITDSANNIKDVTTFGMISPGSTGLIGGPLVTEFYLPAPVAAGTYKVRYRVGSATIPTGWNSSSIDPTLIGGVAGAANFVAEYH